MKNHRVREFIAHPKKAVFTIALPTVVAMLVQTLYNVVDTAYVGRLGAEAIAALTFAFPIFFLLIAINVGLGAGMGSRISRYMGEKKKQAAENTAVHGILISLSLALVMFILGMVFLDPLFLLFGASNSVLELSTSYMSVILMGIFVMFPSSMLNSIFTAQGDTRTPMIIQVTALVINIILDPIFIFVLGYGVRGAAIATVIALSISLLLYLALLKRRSYLRISLKCFEFRWHLVKDIFRVGAPASFMMILMSIYVILVNRVMVHFGTDYVAVFGMVWRLGSTAMMPIFGFGMAALTLVGMFYGAKRYDLVKQTVWYIIRICVGFTAFMAFLFFLFPGAFLRIFTPDQNLISLGVPFVRIAVLELPLVAISITVARSMQGMGLGLPGLVINLIRSLLVSVPLAYLFVFAFGYTYISVAVAVIIGSICASATALIWMRLKLRWLLNGG
ncbi:MATE family efflux transporter [Candidatus Woesearchaeota archaeon]|nr:MATE family efflux transporter [Candidatus Woesearchaeota archaeon]